MVKYLNVGEMTTLQHQLWTLLDCLCEPSRYNDDAVRVFVREHPEMCQSRYRFGIPRSSSGYNTKALYPLFVVCSLPSSPEVVKLVYDAHPAAFDDDNNDDTPLDAACKSKAFVETVRFLALKHPKALEKEEGKKRKWTPLHYACLHGASSSVVKLLVEQAPEVLQQSAGVEAYGDLPLHLACRGQGSLEVVKVVVEGFPNAVKEIGGDGLLPLHAACENHAALEVVEYLVEEFPDSVRAVTAKGLFPLHQACLHSASLDVIRFLLDKNPGCIKTETHDYQDLPLHLACQGKASLEVVQYLAKTDLAGVSAVNNRGFNPLHCACESKASLEVVEFLVAQFREGIKAKTKMDNLPIHLSLYTPSFLPDVVRFLLKMHPEGAGERNNKGFLPLHLACQSNASLEVVEALVKEFPYGVRVPAKQGAKPLDIARTWCSTAQVMELLEVTEHRTDYSLVFQKLRSIDDNIQEVGQDVKEVNKNVQAVDKKMVMALHFMGRLDSRLVDKVPQLFIMVPANLLNKWEHPRSWLRSQVQRKLHLYFICAHSLTPVEPPIKVKETKEWVQQIAPALGLSLVLLNIAFQSTVGLKLQIGSAISLGCDQLSDYIGELSQVLGADGELLQHIKEGTLTDSDLVTINEMGFEMVIQKAAKDRKWRDYVTPVRVKDKATILWVKNEYAGLDQYESVEME